MILRCQEDAFHLPGHHNWQIERSKAGPARVCDEPTAFLVRSRVRRVPGRGKKCWNLVLTNKVVRQRRDRRPPGGGCTLPLGRWANMRVSESRQMDERVYAGVV